MRKHTTYIELRTSATFAACREFVVFHKVASLVELAVTESCNLRVKLQASSCKASTWFAVPFRTYSAFSVAHCVQRT